MNEELDRIRSEYTKRDAADTSKAYHYTNPAFLYHMQERERGLIRMLQNARIDLSESDVLEVGCGTGHILQRFLDFGARSVVGAELMPYRIRMGRSKYAAARLLCADAAHLPLPSESFGVVAQFMCLSSVLESKLRKDIAAEMWRVLAPGGVVLSYDMRPGSILQSLINRLAQNLTTAGSNGKPSVVTPVRPLGIRELRGLFPEGTMKAASLSLNFNLAAVAGISWPLACTLSAIPALRSHNLVMIRKPLEANHEVS